MKRRTVLLSVLVVVLFALGCGWAFLSGGTYALNRLHIASATPTQLAQAMGSDNFWGLWRESTLVVTGDVVATTQQGPDTILEFKTSSVLKTYCNMGNGPSPVKPGDNVTVLTEGPEAQRLTDGVMLEHCTLL